MEDQWKTERLAYPKYSTEVLHGHFICWYKLPKLANWNDGRIKSLFATHIPPGVEYIDVTKGFPFRTRYMDGDREVVDDILEAMEDGRMSMEEGYKLVFEYIDSVLGR